MINVGVISMPDPAAVAIALVKCTGVTDIPWPKEMVMTSARPQRDGSNGAPNSGISKLVFSNKPS